MDQIKIGKFIAEKRKAQSLTQMQLAELLGITDRAVSKWETGRSLPDATLMLDLCGILKITVNDLLSGEVVSMTNYSEASEKNLLDMVSQKEATDRRLLKMELVLGALSAAFLLAMLGIGVYFKEALDREGIALLLIGVGLLQFVIAALFALRIEQVAGCYERAKRGHRYVPSYLSVTFAMHVNRSRYMKCPLCRKRSWQKKVLTKE